MYNRCNGVSGRVERVRERGDGPEKTGSGIPDRRAGLPRSSTPENGKPLNPARGKPGLIEQLGGLIPRALGELETEDVILLLILYLMYRDSGDTELLIIMGAMLLL